MCRAKSDPKHKHAVVQPVTTHSRAARLPAWAWIAHGGDLTGCELACGRGRGGAVMDLLGVLESWIRRCALDRGGQQDRVCFVGRTVRDMAGLTGPIKGRTEALPNVGPQALHDK